MINDFDNWNDKVVVDVGAECGDTALYYANLGAKVFAFEPLKENFDKMIQNLSLNPEISKRITPINAALGEDGELIFYQNTKIKTGGVSFVTNIHGKNIKEIKA